MKRLAAAAAILLLTGCATVPVKQEVNRAVRADKYTKPAKIVQPAPMPTPNQVVRKRWQWPNWLHR